MELQWAIADLENLSIDALLPLGGSRLSGGFSITGSDNAKGEHVEPQKETGEEPIPADIADEAEMVVG